MSPKVDASGDGATAREPQKLTVRPSVRGAERSCVAARTATTEGGGKLLQRKLAVSQSRRLVS